MTSRIVTHPRPVVALAIVVAITMGGCTNNTPGTASGTTPTSTAHDPTTSPSNANPAADPLANTNPCALIDPTIVSQNQLQPGKTGTNLGARFCRWNKNADSSGPGYIIGINIYDHAGLDQLNTADFTVTNYPLGKHQGRLSKDPAGGTCNVSIAVTSTSRVDIVGVDGEGRQAQSCTVATLVAPSVEQKLPVEGN